MKKPLIISLFALLIASGCKLNDVSCECDTICNCDGDCDMQCPTQATPEEPQRPNETPADPDDDDDGQNDNPSDPDDGEIIPTNVIWYTSSDGKTVEPYNERSFGTDVSIVSNTYENGAGIIKFDAPVTMIGKQAFDNCSRLTSVTIPDGVTMIGDLAFSYCRSLTEITIPDGVTVIGKQAFLYCSSLTSVTIPDGVSVIKDWTFCDCHNLAKITIPEGVTTIESLAFYACPHLTQIYCKATVPPVLGGNSIFFYDLNVKIYVPRESVNDYKKNWSKYSVLIQGYDFE